MRQLGHEIQATPDDTTNAILTTAPFGKDMNWRDALLLTTRRRFQLKKTSTVYTMLCTTPGTFSESVEMMGRDHELPTVTRTLGGSSPTQVPVLRSKLHGHRGIAAYHPQFVEYAPLDEPFYHYLVSCATDAQARGIQDAFARAETLRNPEDPRQVVFSVLPGHGTVIVEKWVEGKSPFQVIWEYMDAGYLQVANRIPQGPMAYVPGADGRNKIASEV